MPGFEEDLKEAIGDQIKDDEVAKQVWCALANVDWYNPATHESYGCSWRYAGGLIAEMRGEGDYMDWYMCGQDGEVSDFIRRSMKKRGWIFDATSGICDEPGCLENAGCGWNDGQRVRYTCGKHMRKHIATKTSN